MLNKMHLDKTLFHIPKSHGSYIDSKTGRPTSIGKKAKEKLFQVQGETKETEGSMDQVLKKIRRCPSRCVVYCATADPKDKGYKITQTTLYCCTCLVSLCTKKKETEGLHALKISPDPRLVLPMGKVRSS